MHVSLVIGVKGGAPDCTHTLTQIHDSYDADRADFSKSSQNINDDPVRVSPCQRLFNPDYGSLFDTA